MSLIGRTARSTPFPLRPLQLILGEAWQPAMLHSAKTYCTGEASVIQLSETSTLLKNLKNGAEVYVVGTAHVSAKSAKEVRKMMRKVKPNAVVLELCEERLEGFRTDENPSPGLFRTLISKLGVPRDIQTNLVGLGLSGMYAPLRAAGYDPGAEFKTAIREADRIGAKIVCGDRDTTATTDSAIMQLRMKDVWRLLTLSDSDLPPESSGSLEEVVEGMKTREGAKQMIELARSISPGAARAFIDERDELLAKAMLAQHGKVVGVVGVGHLEGIEKFWKAEMSSRG